MELKRRLFRLFLRVILPTVFLLSVIQLSEAIQAVKDREYWYTEAQKDLTKRLDKYNYRKPRARSVVMFVGDGMSVATVTAARELKAQRLREMGDESQGSGSLIWDQFPAAALAKTYNLNAQTGESSACATALLCGVKANYETLGLDGRAKFENCSSSFSTRVPSVLQWAQEAGMWTGFVSTTRVTHATPAALYAHTPSRYWEDDSKVPPGSRKSCKDIALQLVDNEPGKNINVILGGGRRHWLPSVASDPEQPAAMGRRLDGRNLMDDWIRDKKKRKLRAEYVWNKEQFDKIDTNQVDYLLGLFDYSHMNFDVDRDKGPKGDPSLLEMTLTAISILERSPKGFFLMVEGGRIDHAHHYNNAFRALDETLQLEAAVRSVVGRADLLVVTSDHGHVMTIGGHGAPRNHPVLGMDVRNSDVDGNPYNTLLYGSGPGFGPRPTQKEPDDLEASTESTTTVSGPPQIDVNMIHPAAAPKQWATHGAEDVPVYAMGPLANVLFSGTFEQSYIPHAVAYIACLGEQAHRCLQPDNFTNPQGIPPCPDVESNMIPRGDPVVIRKSLSPGSVMASSVISEDSNQQSSSSRSSHFVITTVLLYLVKYM